MTPSIARKVTPVRPKKIRFQITLTEFALNHLQAHAKANFAGDRSLDIENLILDNYPPEYFRVARAYRLAKEARLKKALLDNPLTR